MINIHALYRFFFRYFRKKRMQHFQERFGATEATRILDVGGTPFNWTFLPTHPKLCILNITKPNNFDHSQRFTWVIADGKKLPFKDNAFDIAYSNSVIEHLGNIENQKVFAKEVRRIARSYFIQTPNKWFPVEPHYMALFIHWLPRRYRQLFVRNFTIRGLLTRPPTEEIESMIEEIRLLDQKEMKILFPEGDILLERFLWMVKSLIAMTE